MKIGNISQCTNELKFAPKAKWPAALPSIAWNEILVAGFNRTPNDPCLFITDQERSLEELLSSLYPQLTFVELSRLWKVMGQQKLTFDWPKFCSVLQYRWNEDWPQLFEIMSAAPQELAAWWSDRDISARDLAPLKALKDRELLARWYIFAKETIKFQPTRSEGVQVLEWLVDLFLIGGTHDDYSNLEDMQKSAERATSYPELKAQIERARFPNAMAIAEKSEALATRLPWPVKTKAAWVRRGDTDGFEIKLFASSPEELNRQIAALKNVEGEWRS